MPTPGSASAPDTHLEIQQPDAHAQYILRDAREIAYVLRQLGARRAVVTAWYGRAGDFLTTGVIDVAADNRSLILDLGRDEAAIAGALAAGRLLCATQLDKVKIQFPLEHLERCTHEAFPALRTPLPDILLRLQRREYYRLSAPSLDSLACQIPLRDGRKIHARILDISGGGLAIVAPPGGEDLQVGTIFENCRLELPDSPPLTVSLQVRNMFRMSTRGSSEVLRAGCQLVHLRAAEANLIQRYILRTERERNHYRV